MNSATNPTDAETGETFLSAEDVAIRLRIAKTSTYELLAKGRLSHFRIGRLIRIREADLLAYLESVRVARTTSPQPKYARYPQT